MRFKPILLCFIPFAILATMIAMFRSSDYIRNQELERIYQTAATITATPQISTSPSSTSSSSKIDSIENKNQQQQKEEEENEAAEKLLDEEIDSVSHGAERIHIAVISHGWHTAKHYHDEMTVKGPTMSLKLCLAGILKYTTVPVTLYFVTGEKDEAPIRSLLQNVKYWRQDLQWKFVRLDEEKLDVWMDAIGHKASHRTGRAGNIKFFYPLVFPSLTKLLMLDTDVLIQHDLKDLWLHFHRFEHKQLYAMAPQWQGSVHPIKDNQFNAGVMLLRLDRMRKSNWLKLSKDSINYWHAKGYTPRCCTHGDQTVFHMIRAFRPGALGKSPTSFIPRHWNINKCHGYQGVSSHKETDHRLPKHMPYVGLVHLGCCRMCTKKKIGPRWSKVVDELNSTDFERDFLSSSSVSVEVKGEVVFVA